MRISTIFQFLLPLVLFGISYLFLSGTLSFVQFYHSFQRLGSGVIGRSAEAVHSVKTDASIALIDRYTFAGQLDATLRFADPEGRETVYDVHYPGDYTMFFDGLGPMWLANWRPDIANNPQVTPVLGNSCLQTVGTENLAPSVRYRTGFKEYIVCRFLDEQKPDAPRVYDISGASPAVIGVIWASPNHQPIDIPRERCIAEMRIWSAEIAQPGDRFMACLFVVNETPEQVEVFAFELTDDTIVEVGGANESWSRASVPVREDAPRLNQYRLMQTWLLDDAAHDQAIERAHKRFEASLDQIIPHRVSRFDGVELRDGIINFTFSARNTAEMVRIRDESIFGADLHLYRHIRPVICGSDERAALLAFQENRTAYMFDLFRNDGRPLTRFGRFPNLPC